MRVLDLCCGTGSVGCVFKRHNHVVVVICEKVIYKVFMYLLRLKFVDNSVNLKTHIAVTKIFACQHLIAPWLVNINNDGPRIA